jgi:uncharacterized protein (TIGR02217 family)
MSVAVFPSLAGLEYPVLRTPMGGATLVQTSVSGKENRAALWTYPRWKWTLSFNFLRDNPVVNEFRTLVGFYIARQGSYDSFLFSDPDDRSAAGQNIGVGDGSTLNFQLVRGLGGFAEPVLAPQAVSTVYLNGTPLAGGAWSVNPLGGVVTFTSAPASGVEIAADFTFYWPVRFMADEYDFAKFMNLLWEQKKLDLISLKNWP